MSSFSILPHTSNLRDSGQYVSLTQEEIAALQRKLDGGDTLLSGGLKDRVKACGATPTLVSAFGGITLFATVVMSVAASLANELSPMADKLFYAAITVTAAPWLIRYCVANPIRKRQIVEIETMLETKQRPVKNVCGLQRVSPHRLGGGPS